MRMYDLILKKRNGLELSTKEITSMIQGYLDEEIPDYQMSAILMAIYYKGMTDEEMTTMTNIVANSGDIVDLSGIEGVKVDKHSTGGVGDKTTLIITPMVAACGVKVAKMSGRGLGHTGGTVDKLESIPGFRTTLTQEEFFDVVNTHGLSVIGQSGNLAPADKKIYALRDVTATIDSLPLIAVSIMSKKLASGSDKILLDIKTGSGAFMKTLDSSIELGEKMVAIGNNAGKETIALVTDMDIPLGFNIGNSLEVIESIETLKNNGPKDLTEICIELASNMVYLAGKGTIEDCKAMVKKTLEDGSAYKKFVEMVQAQGGDISVIEDTNNFAKAPYSLEILSNEEGYIKHMNTEACGIASSMLGAGRKTLNSDLDFSAGIILKKKVGDFVKKNEIIGIFYTSDEKLFDSAKESFLNGLEFSDKEVKKQPLIFARIEKDKIKKYI